MVRPAAVKYPKYYCSLNLDSQHNCNALMYADDLIIVSPTKDGLQNSRN